MGRRMPAAAAVGLIVSLAAGVVASPAAKWIGAPADWVGRVEVTPDLSVPGHPDIFAVGDTAAVFYEGDKSVPGIAPAALPDVGSSSPHVTARRLWDPVGPRGATAGTFCIRHPGGGPASRPHTGCERC